MGTTSDDENMDIYGDNMIFKIHQTNITLLKIWETVVDKMDDFSSDIDNYNCKEINKRHAFKLGTFSEAKKK